MTRVTIWYEYLQEYGSMTPEIEEKIPAEWRDGMKEWLPKNAADIKRTYPNGLMETLAKYLRKNPDFEITMTNILMPDYGLSEELLDNTDVLIYWAHVAHNVIPDEAAFRIVKRVQAGMGFIPLHSAHQSKPFMYLLGTSGTLRWRNDDFCRIWTAAPSHPITEGIPEYVELSEEEMYGEPFDIPKPDETVFISWFGGGEVFRSGCTWTRGYGKIFYFQPGHETSPSYHNPYVLKIIENAVCWAAPNKMRDSFECPHIVYSPEEARRPKN